ncbi:MAG: chemotaxis protein CheA, partial [Acidobacteriota bacterium]
MEGSPFHLNEQDFRAEASELLEAMAREMDQADRTEQGVCLGAERINAIFRAVHSFKGLCGMFGHDVLSDLSHHLEDYLDRLRMGRSLLNLSALDLLFDAHEVLEALVGGGEADVSSRSAELLQRMNAAVHSSHEAPVGSDDTAIEGVDESLLKSLTRYEEHRLRESKRTGKHLYLVRVEFEMETFDSDLKNLTKLLAEKAEIISTMPSLGASSSGEGIGFQILVAAEGPLDGIDAERGRSLAVESLALKPDATTKGSASPETPEETRDERSDSDTSRGSSRDASVRVDLNRLDQIMDSVGEIILSRRRIARVVDRLQSSPGTQRIGDELNRYSEELNLRLSELQRYVIGARMVPVSRMVARVSRLARKLSRQSGKPIILSAVGESTELDKVMIDGLAAPLMHLVRNAIDHGIESGEERAAAGKPPSGQLRLTAAPRGNSVVISLNDDGRGIQVEEVRRSALEKGLIDAETKMSLEKACELIFQPGFSSSRTVNEISGRGYGMDVVRRNIEGMRGRVS